MQRTMAARAHTPHLRAVGIEDGYPACPAAGTREHHPCPDTFPKLQPPVCSTGLSPFRATRHLLPTNHDFLWFFFKSVGSLSRYLCWRKAAWVSPCFLVCTNTFSTIIKAGNHIEGSLLSLVSQKTGLLLVFSPGLPLLVFLRVTVGPTMFSAIFFWRLLT